MLPALLLTSLAHAPAARQAPAPPAWRAAQIAALPPELATGARGQLQGAPPCLSSLPKVGRRQGQRAAWYLGSYHGTELELDVLLQLDRNPDEPCVKLQFVRSSPLSSTHEPPGTRLYDNEAHRSQDRPRLAKVGYMLLACSERGSARFSP